MSDGVQFGGDKNVHGNAGSFMAMGKIEQIPVKEEKVDENRLSNKNLPGGLFTHPGVLS